MILHPNGSEIVLYSAPKLICAKNHILQFFKQGAEIVGVNRFLRCLLDDDRFEQLLDGLLAVKRTSLVVTRFKKMLGSPPVYLSKAPPLFIAVCSSVDGSILSGAAVFAAKSKDAGHQVVCNLL